MTSDDAAKPDDGTAAHDAEELARLRRFLTRPGPRFGLALATQADALVGARLRAQVSAELVAAGLRVAAIELRAADAETDIVAQLSERSRAADVVFVTGVDPLVGGPDGRLRTTDAISTFNFRRDDLPDLVAARVVIWLSPAGYVHLASAAGDLLQVMLTRFEFRRRRASERRAQPRQVAAPSWLDWRDIEREAERPALERQAQSLADTVTTAANDLLAADAAASAAGIYASLTRYESAAEWMQRAANIYEVLGRDDPQLSLRAVEQRRRLAELHDFTGAAEAALREVLEALDLARRTIDRDPSPTPAATRALAACLHTLADIHRRRGQLDEALRIREQELAAQIERLEDRRLCAENLGEIATLRGDQGDFAAAAESLLAEVAPLYAALDDDRALALTYGEAARWLRRSGAPDRALRTLREDALPRFEQLGDRSGAAACYDEIAEVLSEQGYFEEAQDIRETHLLPAYRSLGQPLQYANAVAKLAAELAARGQLEPALRLREDEELPTPRKRAQGSGRAGAKRTRSEAPSRVW